LPAAERVVEEAELIARDERADPAVDPLDLSGRVVRDDVLVVAAGVIAIVGELGLEQRGPT
jgi:hypothetical protein